MHLRLCVYKLPGESCLNLDSDSEGLKWGLKFRISNRFLGDADTVHPQTMH